MLIRSRVLGELILSKAKRFLIPRYFWEQYLTGNWPIYKSIATYHIYNYVSILIAPK